MDMENLEKLAATFKALSHPHRLAIFMRLATCCQPNECDEESCSKFCIGELGEGLKIGQSTLSHHFKELSRAGLIRSRKCGQNTECWVTANTLDELAEVFKVQTPIPCPVPTNCCGAKTISKPKKKTETTKKKLKT